MSASPAGQSRDEEAGLPESGPNGRRVSEILEALIAQGPAGHLTLGELTADLGDRSFGVLLLFLSLPNAVGIGVVPGLSTLFALPQVALALQMLFGRRQPWMPTGLSRRRLARRDLVIVARRSLPTLRRVERILRPRWEWLFRPAAERLIGLVTLLLAGVVALPIPFANQPPAIAIALIALGLIEKDGLYVCLGLLLAVLALAVAAIVILGGIGLLVLLASQVGGL